MTLTDELGSAFSRIDVLEASRERLRKALEKSDMVDERELMHKNGLE